MGTLKEKFEELSAGIKASGKPAAAWFPKYTSTSLLNADNWWEALAVCEYALDTREDEKLTEGFFELIFSAFDCNVEVRTCGCVQRSRLGAERCTVLRGPLWKAGYELFVPLLREGCRYGLG